MPGTKQAQACGKLQWALQSVNRFVSSTQQTLYGTLIWRAILAFVLTKMCKTCKVL